MLKFQLNVIADLFNLWYAIERLYVTVNLISDLRVTLERCVDSRITCDSWTAFFP